MKRALLAPLCSALVIPGLGQIINGQWKKAVAILIAVFLLFLAGVIWLFHTLGAVARGLAPAPADPNLLLHHLQEKDLTLVWFLVLAFGFLWFFSVLDAFLKGRRIDKKSEHQR